MKISIITVVYNGEAFLKDCIASVLAQDYPDVEYIVVDGGSKDATLSIIEAHRSQIHQFTSGKDQGLYDAINKGIKMATGDVIGLIHADDMLAADDVISQVAKLFNENPDADGLYGDLNYIHPENRRIIRKWISKESTPDHMKQGWMPAHPTLYLKRSLFEQYGGYALDMGSAADYDLILRFFFTHRIQAKYLPILMVNMRTGGVSNQSLKSRYDAFKNDYKALRRNKIPSPLFVVLNKKFGKLTQFFKR